MRRWLTGETESRPTARQLVRLRIAARIGEQRRARARGAGWLERLRALFGRVVEREVIERHRDQEDSALHNPFRWVSWEAFRAARRRAGLPTRRRPPERWRRR